MRLQDRESFHVDPAFTRQIAMKFSLRAFWRGLLADLGLLPASPRTYSSEADLLEVVKDLAAREQRSEKEVTAELVSLALRRRDHNQVMLRCWETLSYREQQVAALACLNRTNRQIAAQLQISPDTVKTHTRNVLAKFELRRKPELVQALSDWDFSAWVDTR